MTTTNKWNKDYSNDDYLNLTYRKGGLEVFANLYGNYYEDRSTSNYEESVDADTLWTIHHNSDRKGHSHYLQGRLGLSYQAGNHSFGLSYRNSYYRVWNRNASTDIITADNAEYDRLDNASRDNTTTYPFHLANAYYNGTVGKTQIDLNVDWMSTDFDTEATTDEQSDQYEDRTVTTNTTRLSRLLAQKLVVSHPLWKGTLSVGEEVTSTKHTDKYINEEGYIPLK